MVSLISRYMENPIELHLLLVKKFLRYLKETIVFGTFSKKEGNEGIIACIDINYVGDIKNKKSTLGQTFLLSSRALSWSSRK